MILTKEFYNRGVTYRVFPGGKRTMIHRWPASKIKGSITYRNHIYLRIKSIIKRGMCVV